MEDLTINDIGAMFDAIVGESAIPPKGTPARWESCACGPWMFLVHMGEVGSHEFIFGGKEWSIAFRERGFVDDDTVIRENQAANDNFAFMVYCHLIGCIEVMDEPSFQGCPDACKSDLALIRLFEDQWHG